MTIPVSAATPAALLGVVGGWKQRSIESCGAHGS